MAEYFILTCENWCLYRMRQNNVDGPLLRKRSNKKDANPFPRFYARFSQTCVSVKSRLKDKLWWYFIKIWNILMHDFSFSRCCNVLVHVKLRNLRFVVVSDHVLSYCVLSFVRCVPTLLHIGEFRLILIVPVASYF